MPKILKEQGDGKEAAISGKQEESGQTDARKSKGVKSLLDSYFFLLYK